MKRNVICIVMGGGRGTRLYPLTKQRSKPAAPLAGKYRLVDIPISNCLNSGFNKIFVLTQFNTASLHQHIQASYKFDPFNGGFVDILSAEQTEQSDTWYQGTADAVRQNLHHFGAREDDLILILSGDQLYQMDMREMVDLHERSGSEVTIAAKAMPKSQVEGLGLMRIENDQRIAEFVEKPKDPKVIDGLVIPDKVKSKLKHQTDQDLCLANMGIYVFNKKTLYEALDSHPGTDFGKEIIPALLEKSRMYSYLFEGYWEDIGTVKAFFEANLALTDLIPEFNLYHVDRRIYTRARYLPPSKINHCSIDRAMITDGCIINDAKLQRCVIGVRSFISDGAHLRNVVMMGQDFFEGEDDRRRNRELGIPDVGIGPDCHITNAIIDKNARIGSNVRLSPEGHPDGFEKDGVVVRDGILVVHKNSVIPNNTIV